ncbi:MAG: ArsR/SmtB family transcription factor [Acidobacteriota bacterium]
MNIDKLCAIFKGLSDKTRLRIVNLLIRSDHEPCVCEIVDALNEPQYKVSKQLKELKFAGLIKDKKEGRWVMYSLVNDNDVSIKLLLKAISSVTDDIFAKDEERLRARLSLRKNRECVVGMGNKEWKEILRKLEKRNA